MGNGWYPSHLEHLMAIKFQWTLAVFGRFIGMTMITVFAILVMIAVNLKGRRIEQTAGGASSDNRETLVSIREVHSTPIEIVDKYSGTLRPFERFSLSFKMAGRVIELGTNSREEELDEGDEIRVGQVLARLDTRLLAAQKAELLVSRDFARLEFEKARELRQTQGAISDTQFNLKKSELDVANAKLKTLELQIEDGVLRSPVSGVISKRMFQAGESVNLGQSVFEVIQVDQLKLVVGIPESKVHRLIKPRTPASEILAYVKLVGQPFGDRSDGQLMGKVDLVSEASDDKSGLFEVEILLDNRARRLRPGMIAIARIVVDEFEGFEIPADAVFVRQGETFVFVVQDSAVPKTVAGEGRTDAPPTEVAVGTGRALASVTVGGGNLKTGYAHKHVFQPAEFEFQGESLVARGLPTSSRRIIVGGHRRLVEGRPVRVVDPDQPAR